MLKKNCMRAISIVLVFALFVPFNAFATTLNEDVSITRPLEGNMETAAEATAVDTQLSGSGSSAALTDDSKQSSFSLKVTVTDEDTNPYAAYILVESDPFSIAEYSSVTLWIKPGAGADWIEFYTNSTLITCDENGDGRYEVGTELLSGKWNEITLSLLNTETGITQGNGLTVRTDEYSTWSYDGVSSNKSNAAAIDLSTLVNGDTQLNNGNLEFPLNGESTAYEADSTVLVSNNEVVFDETYTTQSDFSGGTFEGGATNNVDGSISLVSELDACSDGTAISGGYYSSYVPANAFDNTTNSWWGSSQSGSAVNGTAFIGYTFSKETKVIGATIKQYGSTNYDVTSVQIQYYNNASLNWETIQTGALSHTYDL